MERDVKVGFLKQGEVESYECDDHTIFIRKMLKSCLAYAKIES